jgi:predicted RNA-binding Zn-ribbon protein involved in translation (DUF1610 family)
MIFMAKAVGKIICPRCGFEMNHHADKVVRGVGVPDAVPNLRAIDPLLGGSISEFHTCPNCGHIEIRNA